MEAVKYDIDTLAEQYKQAEISIPPKEEEHFLLDHTHPIWKWLLPPMMMIVGAIICWVGYWEQ